MKYTYFFLFFLFFSNLNFLSANQKEWEKHSENITILDTEDVEKIINSKSTILIDVWKKDIKPEKLDPKKWMPAQRYSIPGAKWLPNVGLEILTPEIRMYFEPHESAVLAVSPLFLTNNTGFWRK